jgi:hypothetical protein
MICDMNCPLSQRLSRPHTTDSIKTLLKSCSKPVIGHQGANKPFRRILQALQWRGIIAPQQLMVAERLKIRDRDSFSERRSFRAGHSRVSLQKEFGVLTKCSISIKVAVLLVKSGDTYSSLRSFFRHILNFLGPKERV